MEEAEEDTEVAEAEVVVDLEAEVVVTSIATNLLTMVPISAIDLAQKTKLPSKLEAFHIKPDTKKSPTSSEISSILRDL